MKHETSNAVRSHCDKRLSVLLQSWPGASPQRDFEAAVWRRIAAGTAPWQGFNIAGLLRALGDRPVWASALATVVAMVAGLWMGLAAPRIQDQQPAPRRILGERTIAGAYLSMAAGVDQ